MKSSVQLGLETKRRCDLVVIDVQRGVTTKARGLTRLREIEDAMFNENPGAELDGAITFACADAQEEIEKCRAPIPRYYLPEFKSVFPQRTLNCLINPGWLRLDQIRHAAVNNYAKAQSHMDRGLKLRRSRARH